MNAVRAEVEKLVEKELESANKQFPLFASSHEGYAVIKEEVEEAIQEVEWLKEKLGCVWEMIKQGQDADSEIEYLKGFAVRCAIEAIQVSAMCEKFIMSQDKIENQEG